MRYKDTYMEYEKFIIVLTGQQSYWSRDFFEVLLDTLESRKKQYGINSITEYISFLTKLCFTYGLQKEDMEKKIGSSINFRVLRLTQDENPFLVNPELDEIIKDCTSGIDGFALTQGFYLIEDETGLLFHRFSRCINDGVTTDDDYLDFQGLFTDNSGCFYQHFYGCEEYSQEDTAFIAKMLLTVDGGRHDDF